MTLLHPFRIEPDGGDRTVGKQKKGEENTSVMKLVKFTVCFLIQRQSDRDILNSEFASLLHLSASSGAAWWLLNLTAITRSNDDLPAF